MQEALRAPAATVHFALEPLADPALREWQAELQQEVARLDRRMADKPPPGAADVDTLADLLVHPQAPPPSIHLARHLVMAAQRDQLLCLVDWLQAQRDSQGDGDFDHTRLTDCRRLWTFRQEQVLVAEAYLDHVAAATAPAPAHEARNRAMADATLNDLIVRLEGAAARRALDAVQGECLARQHVFGALRDDGRTQHLTQMFVHSRELLDVIQMARSLYLGYHGDQAAPSLLEPNEAMQAFAESLPLAEEWAARRSALFQNLHLYPPLEQLINQATESLRTKMERDRPVNAHTDLGLAEARSLYVQIEVAFLRYQVAAAHLLSDERGPAPLALDFRLRTNPPGGLASAPMALQAEQAFQRAESELALGDAALERARQDFDSALQAVRNAMGLLRLQPLMRETNDRVLSAQQPVATRCSAFVSAIGGYSPMLHAEPDSARRLAAGVHNVLGAGAEDRLFALRGPAGSLLISDPD
jgi:hypothetical protein